MDTNFLSSLYQIPKPPKTNHKLDIKMTLNTNSSPENDDICKYCNILMKKNFNKCELELYCSNCGLIAELLDDDIDEFQPHNISFNSTKPIIISGPNSKYFETKLLGNNYNFKRSQKQNTGKVFNTIMFKKNDGIIRGDVNQEAQELFNEVSAITLTRGTIRYGIMAACIYQKCIEHGMFKEPVEIMQMFNISSLKFSNGCKVLKDLENKGHISLNRTGNTHKKIESIIVRYYNDLDLDINKYLDLTIKLVQWMLDHAICESSMMSCKCVGVILFILNRSNININKTFMEERCKLSKTTFEKISNTINKFTKPINKNSAEEIQATNSLKTILNEFTLI